MGKSVGECARIASSVATGSKRADAYVGAGYSTRTRKIATKRGVELFAKPEARVAEIEKELRDSAIARAGMNREWVMEIRLSTVLPGPFWIATT